MTVVTMKVVTSVMLGASCSQEENLPNRVEPFKKTCI